MIWNRDWRQISDASNSLGNQRQTLFPLVPNLISSQPHFLLVGRRPKRGPGTLQTSD